MNDFEDEIRRISCDELVDIVDKLEVFNQMDYWDNDDINTIFRYIHSIKGICFAASFSKMAESSHFLEDMFIKLREGKEEYSEFYKDVLNEFLKIVLENIDKIKKEGLEVDNFNNFNDKLKDKKKIEKSQQNFNLTKNSVQKLLKVLIVEDDQDLAEVVKALLMDNYEVEVQLVNNGKDAMNLLKTISYDVILTDFYMPKMNGMDLVSFIRKENSINEKVPILFITGLSPEIRPDLEMWSNVFFVKKPFKSEQLIYYIKCSLLSKKVLQKSA